MYLDCECEILVVVGLILLFLFVVSLALLLPQLHLGPSFVHGPVVAVTVQLALLLGLATPTLPFQVLPPPLPLAHRMSGLFADLDKNTNR